MPRFPNTRDTQSGRGSVYSAFAEVARRAAASVIPLHIGDTYLEPPEGCRMEDLRVSEHPGMHRYTSVEGLPALLEALAARVGQRSGVATTAEQVLLGAGATGALGALAATLLRPGEQVLLLAPYWPLIAGIVRTFGGEPVAVPAVEASIDAAELRRRIVAALTPRTVAIYVNTPSNPTGRVLERWWLETVAQVAAEHDLWVLADEVYEDVVYQGAHVPMRALASDRTFSVHSFSKAFGMAGNRLGYAVGPAQMVGRALQASTHTYYSAPTAAQLAGLRALEQGRGDQWLASTVAAYRDVASRAARRLGVPEPQGSTFLFLDVAARLGPGGLPAFLEDCAREGLLLAPGPAFGPYPTHARLCYTAVPPQQVDLGVDILARKLGVPAS